MVMLASRATLIAVVQPVFWLKGVHCAALFSCNIMDDVKYKTVDIARGYCRTLLEAKGMRNSVLSCMNMIVLSA
eukprot:6194133-Pleurochrysis_carterae.AAC.2